MTRFTKADMQAIFKKGVALGMCSAPLLTEEILDAAAEAALRAIRSEKAEAKPESESVQSQSVDGE